MASSDPACRLIMTASASQASQVVEAADPRAPARASHQRGESPLYLNTLMDIVTCNCVAAKWGGEQQEDEQPVRRLTNSIRPGIVARLRGTVEAHNPDELRYRRKRLKRGKPVALKWRVRTKRRQGNVGWLETEWLEVEMSETGRPVRCMAESLNAT